MENVTKHWKTQENIKKLSGSQLLSDVQIFFVDVCLNLMSTAYISCELFFYLIDAEKSAYLEPKNRQISFFKL